MTGSIKHNFVSPVVDGIPPDAVQPSDWNDEHEVIGALSYEPQTLTTAEQGGARKALAVPAFTQYRNKLINGNFDFWQRATEQIHLHGYHSVDRWSCSGRGGGAIADFHRHEVSDAERGELPDEARYIMRMNVRDAGPNEGSYTEMYQVAEDVRTFAGKKSTVTFYAKADVAGKKMAVSFAQVYNSSERLYSGSQIITLSNILQRYDVVVDMPPLPNVTLDPNNHAGVAFFVNAGSNYLERLGNMPKQTGQFYLGRVSWVEGDASGEDDPFSPRPLAAEFNLCRRYYQIVRAHDMTGVGFGSAEALMTATYPVPMRAAPTVTNVSPAANIFHDGVVVGTGPLTTPVLHATAYGLYTQCRPASMSTASSRSVVGNQTHPMFALHAEF